MTTIQIIIIVAASAIGGSVYALLFNKLNS